MEFCIDSKNTISYPRLGIICAFIVSVFSMKNEDVVALLQAMELKWEQRAGTQMAELKSILEERLAHVVSRSSPLQVGETSMGQDADRSTRRRSDADSDGRELHTLIKSIRVKVP